MNTPKPPQDPLPFLSSPTTQKIVIFLVIVAICLAIIKYALPGNGEESQLELIDATIAKHNNRIEIAFNNTGNYSVELDNGVYSYGLSFYINETMQTKQFQIATTGQITITVTDVDNQVWEEIKI